MKVIVENIEGDSYLEIVLSDLEMDLLDHQRLLTKDVKIKKLPFSLCVRKQTIREKNEEDERLGQD